MSDEDGSSRKEKFINVAISVICALGAMVAGRTVGILGIGAIALGWVAYTYSKNKAGTVFAILIGAVVGLAAYGFAAVALVDLLR